MSMLTPLLWSLLPNQITNLLLPYLSAYLPSIFPAAPKGSPQYKQNYRWAFTCVVIGYLAWSLVREGEASEDWYALLGVPRGIDEEGLKKAYRALSRVYHPDRGGDERVFIVIRRAYEVLSDPIKRAAYDRFGPDMINWKCATTKEYMRTGILHSSGFYLVSGGFMMVLSFLGKAREGSFWRNILFALLFYLELSIILSPANDGSLLLPSQPQFVRIRLLHRIWTAVSIGLTQLGGVWADSKMDQASVIDQVVNGVRMLEMEAIGSFQSEIVPLLSSTNDPHGAARTIQMGMEQTLVERTLASHPAVQPHWQNAITSKRTTVRLGMEQLEVARRIPLPPSPPPSPILGPRR